jgi:hypothetical protein
MYPNFLCYSHNAQVYAVYHEHVDCVRQYACMLWSELDVVSMMAGTDEVRHVVMTQKMITRILRSRTVAHKWIEGQ